jgi:uncharacterized NAD-dependent epimerase/dehydratase family protein
LKSKYQEYAGFANATVHFTDQFDLDFGGRYSHNKQSAAQTASGVLAGNVPVNTNLRSSDNVFTYSVAPKYKFSRHASIYARIAKGYRPGGPNVIAPNAPANTPVSFKPDTVTSYEVGLKGETENRMFSWDVAAYHIDWKNIQLLTVVNNFGVNINGASAKSDGAEFTLTYRPVRGLVASVNGAYTNSRLRADTPTQVGGRKGDRLPFTPPFSLSGNLDYSWSLSSGSTAFVGGSARYLSRQTADYDNTFRTANGSQRKVPAYTVVDLRAGVDVGRLSVEAFVRNLTNADGKTSTGIVTSNGFVPASSDRVRSAFRSPPATNCNGGRGTRSGQAAEGETEANCRGTRPVSAVPRRHDRTRLCQDGIRAEGLGPRALRRRASASWRDGEHRAAAHAAAAGAKALLIGVATPGGLIREAWLSTLHGALLDGLDLVSGMHVRLHSIASLREAAAHLGRRLVDVRDPPADIPIASGRKRSGKRILTVGTDCALGKKYTALAIERGLRARGIIADFRATGQTGIMIAGSGIPIDAVVADFVSGAAEMLSPDAAPNHIDVIEGQGSLYHPAYAPVSLGLLHGSQPDMFIVCHEPGRTHILGHPHYALPSIEEVIALTIACGRLTNPAIRCAGISLNTSKLDDAAAATEIEATARRLGLPTADPVRGGADFERLLDACAA